MVNVDGKRRFVFVGEFRVPQGQENGDHIGKISDGSDGSDDAGDPVIEREEEHDETGKE